MKDPFYGYLMAVIEKEIAQADTEAKEHGRQFTDSQVRSALIKAIQIAKGEKPAIPAGSEHDRMLAGLISRILRKREQILTRVLDENGNPPEENSYTRDQPIPPRIWILAMETTAASLKIRTQMNSGSRGYLDFIHDFIKTMPASIIVKR